MARQLHPAFCVALVLAALRAAASAQAGDDWHDFRVTIDPSSPTDEQAFDLRASRWFGDTGYQRLDQSISINGSQIGVSVLIQDLHTNPDWGFAQVLTPYGAFFNDVGPFVVGTYQVDATMWLTPWPLTSGGSLIDSARLTFAVTGTALDGDFNGDGVVDAGDYTVWRNTMGQTGSGLAADGNGDLVVDHLDYQMWKGHFGQGSGGGSFANSSATPEPASLLLAFTAIAATLVARSVLRTWPRHLAALPTASGHIRPRWPGYVRT